MFLIKGFYASFVFYVDMFGLCGVGSGGVVVGGSSSLSIGL